MTPESRDDIGTEWYTRLEKGHIAGVSEEVLDAVAAALRLDDTVDGSRDAVTESAVQSSR